MSQCTELAVFKVAKENVKRAIELSKAIFSEMNSLETVITSSEILVKIDDPEEICWHIKWKNAEVAKLTTAKWSSFASTSEFQSLVLSDLYYGHFTPVVVVQT